MFCIYFHVVSLNVIIDCNLDCNFVQWVANNTVSQVQFQANEITVCYEVEGNSLH